MGGTDDGYYALACSINPNLSHHSLLYAAVLYPTYLILPNYTLPQCPTMPCPTNPVLSYFTIPYSSLLYLAMPMPNLNQLYPNLTNLLYIFI